MSALPNPLHEQMFAQYARPLPGGMADIIGRGVNFFANRRKRRFKLPSQSRPPSPVLPGFSGPNIVGPPPVGDFNPILSGNPPMRFGAPPKQPSMFDFNPILSGRGPGSLNPPMRFGAPPKQPSMFDFNPILSGRGPGTLNPPMRFGPPPGTPPLNPRYEQPYYQHPFPGSPNIGPFDPGPMPSPFGGGPLAPSALRHLYPGGRGFGGANLLGAGMGRGGGGWGRGAFGPPSIGPDGRTRDPAFYDNTMTPHGPRSIERSVPGRGERMQGRWSADNRPPFGWHAEAWDRGHLPQRGGDGQTGKDRFDKWGIISGLLRGAGQNAAQGRMSRANLMRGAIANFLKERYQW